MRKKQQVSILGAGLVGSLLAVLFQKRGYTVQIFERRSDMRLASMSAGKSINLAMSMRGWAGLQKAGLEEDIRSIAIPMYGRELHQANGETIFQAYGKNNEAIYSVSRGELNKKLMSLAESCGAKIHFNHRIHQVDIDSNEIQFDVEFKDEKQTYSNHDLIIGADGAFSALRNAYVKKDRYNYSQHYIGHGYKELVIPPDENGDFRIKKEALHIWPRRNFMLIALPNTDHSFTCTLFLPFEGVESFEQLKTPADVRRFFEIHFPDTLSLIPNLESDFFQNPTSSLVTVRCFPWIHEDKNLLIGDAAHAIVPFYGQGMNAGFEDCRILAELLDETENPDWHELLKKYQHKRKINGDAVADLALQNFIEMRDKVADPEFLRRKFIEKELGKLFPEIFNSVYEMVSFSHTSYSEAIRSQHAQDILLNKVMQSGDFQTNLNNPSFQESLKNWMQEYHEAIQNIQASL